MLGLGEPRPEPLADAGGDEAVAGDLLSEEVVVDELLETAAEFILALLDERGVRNGQPEGVTEEGRDGEPVRQRADHGGLRGGVDVLQHGRVGPQRGDVDDGGEDEERGREHAHTAQAVAAHLVRGRLGQEAHRAILPHDRVRDPLRPRVTR